LSVRPDLIPIEYADALSTLQDRVPPFPSSRARELLVEELGDLGMEKIKEISIEEPVAAASIGQVYRGRAQLADGKEREVAIKVQRPDVLSEIALDLHIVREFAPLYQKITGAATDFQSLANEWGRGFIAELDYTEEATNTKRFNEEMKERGLSDAVTAPIVVDELSTRRILTTEWVYGTRLDQSTEEDVPRLCTVALNAYLVMLLETGCLHVSKSLYIYIYIYS
jgi:predicted unusual protein kinase regulating ubiquinone biosynthesis (AarF/ABC1/UbiB family)